MQSFLLTITNLVVKACLTGLSIGLIRGLLWLVNMLIIAPPFDPLKNLSGPDASPFQTHLCEVMDPNVSPTTHEEWVRTYGKTFRIHGFGRHDYRLMSLDFRVISHVLNSPIYEKPWQTRSLLSRLVGRGIFSMEGAEHKLQRKLIMPAFSTHAVKSLSPIFLLKAQELRDRWDAAISQAATLSDPTSAIVDTSHWLSRATFDVIGLAGFDYDFHSLQDESEEMYLAYRTMFNIADKGSQFRGMIQIYFPWVEKIFPDEDEKTTQACLQTIKNMGSKIVAEKKNLTMADKACSKDTREKDILSLLIKANSSSDPCTRMTDNDLLDQLSTFLFAGSDSTSLAIAWCIHSLSMHPDVQTRLRDEIFVHSTVSTRAPSPCTDDDAATLTPPPSASSYNSSYSDYAEADAIDNLPYLDAVVRESLRLHPPVHSTIRVATQTDSIPLSSPIVLRDGTRVNAGDSITIGKGSYVHIPIEGLNFSPDIWGEDAREFNPDRWLCLPKSARAPTHPGLANVMTFSFGPHSCPGWKFTIIEMKFFLATLLPYFVFSPVGSQIRKFNAILTRPYVYDHIEDGAQLPVRVSRYSP